MMLAMMLSALLAARALAACPGADPNDLLPDDDALQACLDAGGTVLLDPGEPGYLIRKGLRLRTSHVSLSSSRVPEKARLVADPALFAPMLAVDREASGYSLSYLVFDGDKERRERRDGCHGYRDFGTNLQPRGRSFVLDHIESIRAMCGSSTEVAGADYEIKDSLFAANGFAKGQGSKAPEPWADGLTLLRCERGDVHDNVFRDNTDINVVVGGGHDCRIENNSIEQKGVYGFAGLHVFNFTGGDSGNGDHAGSLYRGNRIRSAKDALAFGIVVGPHPWFWNLKIKDAGTVEGNEVSGAVVGLAVDGIEAGTIEGNRISSSQGTHGFMRCRRSADYTASDFGRAKLQPGYVNRSYHLGGCGNPFVDATSEFLKDDSAGDFRLLDQGFKFE